MYQVSNKWQIKSFHSHQGYKPWHILSPRKHNWGYIIYNLNLWGWFKNYLAHRLVAMAFIPNPLGKKFVNHIDGDKQNNNSDNLEWVTKSENALHAFKLGLMKPNYAMRGRTHNNYKRWASNPLSKSIHQFTKDWIFIKEWGSISEAANWLNLSASNVVNNCKWKLKSTGGFCFKYAKA
jgi:hypothetical protein